MFWDQAGFVLRLFFGLIAIDTLALGLFFVHESPLFNHLARPDVVQCVDTINTSKAFPTSSCLDAVSSENAATAIEDTNSPK